ncbi:uncharacterized protein N7458_000229 [Penicillium daleae]|uniref:Uncharacterized protein n=1 Tax=Penicillium daleae TaxID=63821 RepID=A0AAD6CG67_9EURO|nr:uncharacterized protein N7458_000229 [Penicillium daleae]KAJ5464543.1 hypothetical protein N7458_000229 [Penicillium daleae]
MTIAGPGSWKLIDRNPEVAVCKFYLSAVSVFHSTAGRISLLLHDVLWEMQWRVSDRANGNGVGVGVGVLSMSLLFTGSTYSYILRKVSNEVYVLGV